MLKQIAVPLMSAIVGGLVVILAMPSTKPLPKTIQADKLILNGANGLPRVIVSGGGEGGPSVLLLNAEAEPALTLAVPSDGGNPSIQLGEGSGRIFLTTNADGVAAIVVRDGKGKDRAQIRVDAKGMPAVETMPLEGKPIEQGVHASR